MTASALTRPGERDRLPVKIGQIEWRLAGLLAIVAGAGAMMLYSLGGQDWQPWAPQPQWNHKLLITHGGGAGGDLLDRRADHGAVAAARGEQVALTARAAERTEDGADDHAGTEREPAGDEVGAESGERARDDATERGGAGRVERRVDMHVACHALEHLVGGAAREPVDRDESLHALPQVRLES